MKARSLTLRFSIRGRDGESAHHVRVLMRRRREGGWGTVALWAPVTVEVVRGERSRFIPLHRLNLTQLDELSVAAERKARVARGLKVLGD